MLIAVPDDLLAPILQYVRDATSLLNLAETTPKIRARIQRLARVINYTSAEQRGPPPNTRTLRISYLHDMKGKTLSKPTMKLPAALEELTMFMPGIVLPTSMGASEIPDMFEPINSTYATTLLVLAQSHILDTEAVTYSLSNTLNFPSTLTKLIVPGVTIACELPLMLIELSAATVLAKHVAGLRLTKLTVLYKTDLTLGTLPATITDCVVRADYTHFFATSYSAQIYSRFEQLLCLPLRLHEVCNAVYGFNKLFLAGHMELICQLAEVVGMRKSIHACMCCAAAIYINETKFVTCEWYIAESTISWLPENTVSVICRELKVPIPVSLTKLVLLREPPKGMIEHIRALPNLTWCEFRRVGTITFELPVSLRHLHVVGTLAGACRVDNLVRLEHFSNISLKGRSVRRLVGQLAMMPGDVFYASGCGGPQYTRVNCNDFKMKDDARIHRLIYKRYPNP